MFELWYGIVSVMLAAYVVLDGFDLGAGALHLMVARNDRERRTVLAAIGPFWDANEVWLLAAGGALFVAFPRALSAGLSGFYLAIFLVLWSLILRGVAIEFRSHVGDRLWRGFWDVVFSVASALLPVLFGAALGNLIRGVPLTQDGWFHLTLFTTFQPHDPVGTLDWYTVLAGVFSLVTLAGHGALYLSWRASGPVGERARPLGKRLYILLAVLWPLTTLATAAVNHDLLAALPHRPLALVGVVLAIAGMVGVLIPGERKGAGTTFVASCVFITGMLVATAGCLYPVMLRSTTEPALSITAQNAGSSSAGLATALGWWVIGFPIVVGYFVLLFRLHRGKAVAAEDGEGY